jgi:sulfite dehydrogenase (cytochrome) subunit A
MSSSQSDLSASSRRGFLKILGASGVGALLGPVAPSPSAAQSTPAPGAGAAAANPGEMFAAPEKIPLTLVTDRPLQLETPLKYFRTEITPNDAFYVRTHLASFPTRIDTASYKINVGGHVDQPFSLSLEDIRKLPSVEMVAVNQCSGNSRSFFKPRVAGVQWGNGAMGNAKWKGARLKDILEKAGVKAGSVEVQFDGVDSGVVKETPDYLKSLPLERAMNPDTIVAYEMNGAPLPILNGFPVRLIVAGWYATYWMKWLSEIKVADASQALGNFWMKTAYRVPNSPDANEDPANLSKDTIPINKLNVRSFIVSPEAQDEVMANKPVDVIGMAFDGGSGIKAVEVSVDGGTTWSAAKLGPDLGKYSFRQFSFAWTPSKTGAYRLMSRATANDGAQQPATAIWNRSGYMRNVTESTFIYAS